jgi:hypothetical protein
MFAKCVCEFVREERGGGTIMGLFWFMVLVGICGLAVDSTNGVRNRTMLQATADSAALAAAIDLPSADAAKATAVSYSVENMPDAAYGNVLLPGDVEVGTFDWDSRTFSPGGIVPDAVRVRLHQTAANSNPVEVNFLRIAGYDTWDVNVEAVAQRFIPDCLNDGLIARGLVDISSNNGFVNKICIHGQQGVRMQNHNSYEIGVNVSMPDMNGQLGIPTGGMESNPGLPTALREQSLDPRLVNHVDEMMVKLLDLNPTILPSYITFRGPTDIIEKTKNFNFTNMQEGHVYHISCSSNQTVGIPGGTELRNVVIISDCQIGVGVGVYMHDVVLGSRADGNPGQGGGNGGTTSGGGGSGVENATINMSSSVVLGNPTDDCAPGGGVVILSNASVHFGAGTTFHGVQIIAAGDVDLTAAQFGINGINVQTGGNITLTSNNAFGLCSGGAPSIAEVPYYRLVH